MVQTPQRSEVAPKHKVELLMPRRPGLAFTNTTTTTTTTATTTTTNNNNKQNNNNDNNTTDDVMVHGMTPRACCLRTTGVNTNGATCKSNEC